MTLDSRLREWFPCDLAREDQFGKMLYVGVGSDDLIVRVDAEGKVRLAPITFVYRFEICPIKEDVPISFTFLTPDGTSLAALSGQVPADKTRGTRLNLSFAFNRLDLPQVGEYRWFVNLGGEQHEGKLRFSLPPDESVTIVGSGTPAPQIEGS